MVSGGLKGVMLHNVDEMEGCPLDSVGCGWRPDSPCHFYVSEPFSAVQCNWLPAGCLWLSTAASTAFALNWIETNSQRAS
jgi:hypothetical protein